MPRKNRSRRLLYVLCRLVEWTQVGIENEVNVALRLFLVMLSIESLGQKHVCTTYLDVQVQNNFTCLILRVTIDDERQDLYYEGYRGRSGMERLLYVRRLSGWYDFRWAISKMGFKSSPALLRPLELRHSRTTQMDGQEV